MATAKETQRWADLKAEQLLVLLKEYSSQYLRIKYFSLALLVLSLIAIGATFVSLTVAVALFYNFDSPAPGPFLAGVAFSISSICFAIGGGLSFFWRPARNKEVLRERLEEVVRAASQRLELAQSQFTDKDFARVRIEEAQELLTNSPKNSWI
jgi:hypothetical protein